MSNVQIKTWPLWLCMSAKYAVNVLSEVHVPMNLLFDQKNKTGISAGIPLRAIHSPLNSCQNIVVLKYLYSRAFFLCRFSSKVVFKNEMLFIHAGSVGQGTHFCMPLFSTVFEICSFSTPVLRIRKHIVQCACKPVELCVPYNHSGRDYNNKVKSNHCIWIMFPFS